jgi:hypothetical protein
MWLWPSPTIEEAIVILRGSAVRRSADRLGTVEGIVFERRFDRSRVLHRNDAKGGPTAIEDRKALTAPNAGDDLGERSAELFGVDGAIHPWFNSR